MEAVEAIARLAEKLDEWSEKNLAALPSMDRAAQVKALLGAMAIVKELERLKAEGLTALGLLLNQQASMPEDDRVACLVRGFALGAKLGTALNDELLDVQGYNAVVSLMHSMVDVLDSIGSARRTALAPLLDHPEASVRLWAGVYLVDLMPDRVLPILREIDETEHGCAGRAASHRLSRWEREHKQTP